MSEKSIGRLSIYRRLLSTLLEDNIRSVYSHELAKSAGASAAQVRRDMMIIGYSGSPIHGYNVQELIQTIDNFLDAPEGQRCAIVGVGNLGRALISYFTNRRPMLRVVAAFDNDATKVNRVIHGCRCHPMEDLHRMIHEQDIGICLITVPASAAQAVAETCVRAGVTGILNFAPVVLHLPDSVYVSDIDLTMALEKVAFFARQKK